MTVTRLFRADDPAHRATAELLPWYVNGTLAADECVLVEAHLGQCLRCRRELETQRTLATLLTGEAAEVAIDRGLARVHARIDRMERRWRPAAFGKRLLRGWREARPWLRGALVGELVLVLALVGMLVRDRDEVHLYRTLGAPSAAGAKDLELTIVVNGSAREDELRAILADIGARIIARQSTAYTLEVPFDRADEAQRKLRASPAVRSVGGVSNATDARP